ncbi:MAG: glycosyl hydrolase [Opitutaceae bacterium]|jgi:hypothetical protein
MKKHFLLSLWLVVATTATVFGAEIDRTERQFRELPMEARELTGPLFWLHGDESPERLATYIAKVAEGGNGCFTAESRPHSDWLGPNWYRDLGLCLDAAKKHNLKMWIFDEKWWPSQSVDGRVPPQYAAKHLEATATEIDGPSELVAAGYADARHVATIAGRVAPDGKIDGASLADLKSFIHDGELRWPVPEGKWRVMNFTHSQAPALPQDGGTQLSVDGASRDCVEWYLQTVYQPHYDRFKADFGRTIAGFFYDEPETHGDWGTELNRVLAEWGVDWKKAYVAYKFELSGEEQTAARFQYLDAFADAWGRTLYGGIIEWCHRHGIESQGHFIEHASLYAHPILCAGDLMRLQRYSDRGGIDAVFQQFNWDTRVPKRDAPVWSTPKLASSVSHVFGKRDDIAMVEIFGGRGQNLSYPEMKWWTDHMQVSGVNAVIPHSFNPHAPYDTDCPPYFYNGGFEPRWPLYRVYADYTSRLSVLLSGGRHVCPVALLFNGNTRQVGKILPPETMTEALQDAQYDCDWLPFDVFENQAKLSNSEVQLHQERYRAIVVPPVEAIPYATLAKAKEFFDSGGLVIAYGFLPTKSATLGKSSADIARLYDAIWGRKTNAAGGRAYLLSENPTAAELRATGLPKVVEVLEGDVGVGLHVLHRVKSGRDVFFITNQNHLGEARRFQLKLNADGVPECWDAMRNELTAIDHRRTDDDVELEFTLEPNESVLLVFQDRSRPLPVRGMIGKTVIPVVVDASIPVETDPEIPSRTGRVTHSPVHSNVFHGRCEVASMPAHAWLVLDELSPEAAACVTVNGQHAGGFIGKPFRLDVTRYLKPGANRIDIAPFAPKSARLQCDF